MKYLIAAMAASPQTGDHRNIILYGIIAGVAALLIILFFVLGKRNKKK